MYDIYMQGSKGWQKKALLEKDKCGLENARPAFPYNLAILLPVFGNVLKGNILNMERCNQ